MTRRWRSGRSALSLTACQAILQNRVGGGFTPAVLSHHRAYGSIHGGSGYTTKPVVMHRSLATAN